MKKLLEKLALKFKPTHISIDHGSKDGDYTCKVEYKIMNGKIYVIGVKHEH